MVSAAAEPVERRGGAKENAELQSAVRTRGREAVSRAQARIKYEPRDDAINRQPIVLVASGSQTLCCFSPRSRRAFDYQQAVFSGHVPESRAFRGDPPGSLRRLNISVLARAFSSATAWELLFLWNAFREQALPY